MASTKQEAENAAPAVLRSSRAVSAVTLLSRLLGLVRDKFLVLLFGPPLVWVLDAFIFAFTIPNLFRRVFGEGALTASFLPVFVRTRETESDEAASRVASTVLTALLLATALIAAVGMAVCVGVDAALTPSPQVRLTLQLLVIMLPFLVLICASALLSGMLQGLRSFAIPAAMSIVLNGFFIGTCLYILLLHWPDGSVCSWYEQARCAARALRESGAFEAIRTVALGVVLAGATQLLIQWPLLRVRGVALGPSFNLSDKRMRQVIQALGPTALGLGVVQVNVLLDNIIAYAMSIGVIDVSQAGATTYLYLGNRLMQLPLGVIGIAIATTAFPFLATAAAKKDHRGLLESLTDTMRHLLFLVLPAAVGLIVMADPIIRMIYQEPDMAFSDAAVYRSTAVLACYAAGLAFYSLQHLLTRTYYALGDYRTPVKIAIGMVAVNLVLNLVLIHAPDLYRHWIGFDHHLSGLPTVPSWGSALLADPRYRGSVAALGEAGLALATALTAALNVSYLWAGLRKKLKSQVGPEDWEKQTGHLSNAAIWLVVAALAMGLIVYLIRMSIPPGPELIWRIERALVPCILGVGVYAVVCMIFAIPEWSEYWGSLFGKKPEKKNSEKKRE